MKGKWILGVAALAFVCVSAALADTTGDVLTLYPSSQGAQSYAAWKAQEGRPDSQGESNQALYLEATGDPTTYAAGHVRGFEGTPVMQLVSLYYEHRVPGTCTPTDPRWTLFIRGRGAKRYLINLGCAITPARPTDDPRWIGRLFTQPLIRAQIIRQVRGGPAQRDALGGTVDGLAIVVDRTAKGAVYLDNISVRSRTASKVWTYAGDNGNGVPGQPAAFSAEDLAMLAEPIAEAALLDEDSLFASLTPDEWDLVNAETID